MISLCNVLTALTFFLMPAQTTLYDAALKPIVDLPAGYFVMQTAEAAADGYIAVAYDDLTGFVKESAVQAVDYRPVTKYERTVTFRCDNDGQPVNLRGSPERSAQVLKVMSEASSGRCYGTTRGEALITGGDTLWYYVENDGVRGYCYYAHVSVTPTPPNVIEKEPDPEPELEPSQPTVAEVGEAASMSSTAAIIFIVALCLPVPFIMFYLFRKPKDGS
ncbi:MAG: hypothetical protein NC184_04300 [Roseburia sp.]|nr:hypothetical protein [Roseburia sp.]